MLNPFQGTLGVLSSPQPITTTSALVNLGPAQGSVAQDGATQWLPPVGHGVDYRSMSLFEMLMASGGSAVGQSAVSDWVGCPEYSRLRSLGVEGKPTNSQIAGTAELDAASFGTMMHALRATRILHGVTEMYTLLEKWRADLVEDDYLLAKMMWRVYDTQYPLENDLAVADVGHEVLGVEVEVRTALRAWDGHPVIRSVRYDTIVRYPKTGELYSFECKTMARGGRGSLRPYYKQGASQMSLWNSNPGLVARYGPMTGVLYDCMIKTKNPTADRVTEFFSRIHQELAKKFLLSPEQGIVYLKGPDGRFPQNLTHCYQFFRPCEYTDLCWEHSYGSYQFKDSGDTYDGR